MSDPIFDSRSARFDLPLLFAGQAQKEISVNEALCRLDALICPVVEGELVAPPPTPLDGQAWRISASPSGEWTGQGGNIAARQGGNWQFIVPRFGMRVFDRAAGQDLRYDDGWIAAVRPPAPSGGAVVDAEVRAAFNALVQTLATARILPPA